MFRTFYHISDYFYVFSGSVHLLTYKLILVAATIRAILTSLRVFRPIIILITLL